MPVQTCIRARYMCKNVFLCVCVDRVVHIDPVHIQWISFSLFRIKSVPRDKRRRRAVGMAAITANTGTAVEHIDDDESTPEATIKETTRVKGRPQSPVTIEHRGALYLTATGQLPRAPDCTDTEFCRCDVCARLKDLGYGSRAEYFDAMHRAEMLRNPQNTAASRAESRRQRIKQRTLEAKRDACSNKTSSQSSRSKSHFSPVSSSAQSPSSASRKKDRKLYGATPAAYASPRLSPSKRSPLPRSAGRVPARHDILKFKVWNPEKSGRGRSSITSSPSSSARRRRKSRSSSASPRQRLSKASPRTPGRTPQRTPERIPQRTPERSQSKTSQRNASRKSIRAAPSNEHNSLSKKEPTEDMTKSELIALVLAARAASNSSDDNQSKNPERSNERKTPAESSHGGLPAEKAKKEEEDNSSATIAALQEENLSLKKQVENLEMKLKHETAVSRELCLQVSKLKAGVGR